LRNWARRDGVVLCDFPPYSPDLNPIENLWFLLKKRILEKYPDMAMYPVSDESMDFLVACAQEVWLEIEEEVIENVINSMKSRLRECHLAHGYYTKY
jgi:hypothetical protein